jgi:hypothetical protein
MKYIGFIERFEMELTRLLKERTETTAIVKWASDKVFESYRNGVEVGKNGGRKDSSEKRISQAK